MSLLGVFSILNSAKQVLKEACEPTIPAENWANKELYHKDIMDGVSVEQRMKWVEQGRYKLPKQPDDVHPEPHRDPKTGQIIIENNLLYKSDLKEYGAAQTYTWVKQGKYNLTPEELEKEHELLAEKHKRRETQWKRLEEVEKKRFEEQQKKEAELLRQKKIKQELENARQVMLSECREILTNANYYNIDFSLKHRTGISNEPYGYSFGQISMQKNDEKYTVGFELLSPANLPETNGNSLLKSLATILATVDISDLEGRNSLLKESFNRQEITLRNESEDFNIENDVLTIAITVCSLEVSLQFYTSKVKKQILPLNFDTMDGHEFEFFCASLLRKNGYERINVTRGSGDQGVDIIAYKDDIKYGIQCKCYHSDIGNKAVQEVYAGKTFYNCHVGIVLTNRDFTKSAIELARKNVIILWNRTKLMQMIENCKDII